MIVAVNLNFYMVDNACNDTDFIITFFSSISIKYPQTQFLFFVDKNFSTTQSFSSNVKIIIAKSLIKTPLQHLFWLNYKLPFLLKKNNVNVLVSANGCCCLRTKVTQCVFVSNLLFLQYPNLFTKKWLRFYKKFSPKFLYKAQNIITTSLFLKNQIIANYKIPDSKITVAHPCSNNIFTPVTTQQKENTKQIYTNAIEYFLYVGVIDNQQNLITLLKAFSFFKQRQKSNMQLVLASKNKIQDEAFLKTLSYFKFNHAVKLLQNLSDKTIAPIIASAYAIILPSLYQHNLIVALQAMQCNVPILIKNTDIIIEMCDNATVHINPNNVTNIAEKMMLIFKDEHFKNQLIEKGKQQIKLFDFDKTNSIIWQTILNCMNYKN